MCTRAPRIATAVLALLMAGALLVSCSGGSGAEVPDSRTPTPVTRAARTAAARGTETPIPRFPTAAILLDPVSRRPVFPTPPPTCVVSAPGVERPDLGPTLGEGPIWLASAALPVIPWRNEFVRVVWVVDRSVDGDLILSGKRTDGEGTVRFIRQGAGRITEQLNVTSASKIGAASDAPTAPQYADIPVQLSLPAPGCYELTAKIGETVRGFTVLIYN